MKKYEIVEIKVDHYDPIIRMGIHDFEIEGTFGSFETEEEAYEYINELIDVIISDNPRVVKLPEEKEVMLGQGWTRVWSGIRFNDTSVEKWYTIEKVS